MIRPINMVLAFLVSPAMLAFAQETQLKVQDTLIPKQSIALTWIVGLGILIITLIAGFKSPGRSHLD
jgi:hypothetical protein